MLSNKIPKNQKQRDKEIHYQMKRLEHTWIWSVSKRLNIMGPPSICHHIDHDRHRWGDGLVLVRRNLHYQVILGGEGVVIGEEESNSTIRSNEKLCNDRRGPWMAEWCLFWCWTHFFGCRTMCFRFALDRYVYWWLHIQVLLRENTADTRTSWDPVRNKECKQLSMSQWVKHKSLFYCWVHQTNLLMINLFTRPKV